jgi:hypothetical protein
VNNYQVDKQEFDRIKAARSNWNLLYQICGEYVHMMKQNFTGVKSDGEFLVNKVFDSTAPFAASSAASILVGMVWPGSASQTFELVPPDDLEVTTELAKFYEKFNKRSHAAFDDPRAGLSLALDEYMLDQMVFGTSGIGVEAGQKSKLQFTPYGVQEMYVVSGAGGRVGKLYLFFEWTVERVVKEYGYNNVSDGIRNLYDAKKFADKVQILHIICERKEFTAEKGKYAMPWQGVHLEYKTNFLLKDDGYHEFPINVARFRRLNYEDYGRSPAMAALPDIIEANAMREAIIIATEKQLDPAQGVFHDGIVGGGTIDKSAGAVNVFNASASMGSSNPIFDVAPVGDMKPALTRLEKLEQNIAQHFYIDRLLDLNNETQMTFGEAQIREQRVNSSMLGMLGRQNAEVVTPTIERGVAMLWRMGEFGVVRGSEEEVEAQITGREVEYVPDVIAERLEKGLDIYKVIFKSKAGNAARAQEYISIVDTTNFTLQAMQVDPSLKHKLDLHKSIDLMGEIRGLPVGILRKKDEVEARIKKEQEEMQMMQMLQAGEQVASIAEKSANAEQTMNRRQ